MTHQVERSAAAEREYRLSRGLAAVITATDQLLLCQDEDTLLRRAVELAREHLGVERFAIFLNIPGTELIGGTYGTDMKGQTTRENEIQFPAADFPDDLPAPDVENSIRWIYKDKKHLQAQSGLEKSAVEREWLIATPIHSSVGRIGLAFQDAAISQTPVDDILQDIVTVYCSLLGSMIESKQAAESARQSQRQTSKGLGIVLDIADELVLCEDLDSLLRRTVEMARDRLGVERIGIYLKNGDDDFLRGTYGVSPEGNLQEEKHKTVDIGALDVPTPATKNPLSRLKIYKRARLNEDTERNQKEKGERDWVVTTPIQSSQGVIGVCFNDSAITKHAMDEAQQEKLAVLCSMLGNMIESKRTTEAMRESERSIANLMSNLPGMAYRCLNDEAWTMEFVSEGVLEMTGYAPEALIGNQQIEWNQLIHPDDRSLVWKQVQEALQQRRSFQLTYRIATITGSQKWMSEHGSGIFSAQGELVAIEGFISDITARKQAAEAVRLAKEELETRVDERTRELAQANELLRIENEERQMAMAKLHEVAEALQVAKDEAERANNAKSEFLSRMSHELRTPLNAILGFGQLLEMAALPPKRQEAVTHILKAGRHLLGLINEVLDIARVEAGHLELLIEPVAIDETVKECCDLLQTLAQERSIRLEQSIAELQGVEVLADRQRLKQVLLNLLANAIKYNCEGGRVFISSCQAADGHTCINVRDTGPGLSAEDIGKIFNPFERLNATNTEVEGSGLGLLLSQHLVEAMGGTLQVESSLGEGSTFSIELPQADSSQKMKESSLRDGEDAELLPTAQPKTSKILVIEDNLSNLRLLEVILESRPQVTLLAAMQGSVGLDLARQHEPDLILLDLNLPDISGKEVLSRLQESPLTCTIPVVIISADATSQQVERLLEEGAKQYLTKPLDVKRFLRILDEFLEEEVRPNARAKRL
ncbi:PAS domain S-box-containing protein [Abditibacterium utsteinense]|uniref:histidine kinase n=1 Tax=Abditibacterium utsteinense TaxID=1960156 RepID=A0A2S8SPD8_9BACT|nr:PAS domain-containing hybrid sensor histidine kinase/response regulator [Abditibacterium utsteinense]PQV62644.1 PAS domain S-box-containing protein [Abditibacterium utsteinense]